MSRGIDVGIYLRSGLDNDNFIAAALGNLAAWRLGIDRKERLEWQVFRVEGSAHHHYRLAIRHPERALDLGAKPDLARILDDLSNEDVDALRGRLKTAEANGLRAVPLRTIAQEVDFWQDDFWNFIGGPSGFGGPL